MLVCCLWVCANLRCLMVPTIESMVNNIVAARSTPWFLHGSTIQIHSTLYPLHHPQWAQSAIKWPKCVCIRRAWWRRQTASNSHELRRNSPGKRAPRHQRNHKNRRHTFVWINGIYEPQQKSWCSWIFVPNTNWFCHQKSSCFLTTSSKQSTQKTRPPLFQPPAFFGWRL